MSAIQFSEGTTVEIAKSNAQFYINSNVCAWVFEGSDDTIMKSDLRETDGMDSVQRNL